MNRLEGKVALITGGGQGIGEGIARAMHAEGASVVLADISGRQDEVAADLGERAVAVRADVSSEDDAKAMVAATVEAFGKLDVLCNNAGIEGAPAPLGEASVEEFDRMHAVNLRGAFLCMRHAIPAMLPGGGGVIINIASIAGIVAFPGMACYSATKAGLLALTRGAAVEYGEAGIRANTICPGLIRTAMVEAMERDAPELFEQMLAGARAMNVGRMGLPGDIAAATVFLASDECTFLSGAEIPVDGAYTAT